MSILDDAIETLTNHYGSLDVMAQRLEVDAKQVADALAKANPDSSEFIALTYLAKYNPYTPTKSTPKVEE